MWSPKDLSNYPSLQRFSYSLRFSISVSIGNTQETIGWNLRKEYACNIFLRFLVWKSQAFCVTAQFQTFLNAYFQGLSHSHFTAFLLPISGLSCSYYSPVLFLFQAFLLPMSGLSYVYFRQFICLFQAFLLPNSGYFLHAFFGPLPLCVRTFSWLFQAC